MLIALRTKLQTFVTSSFLKYAEIQTESEFIQRARIDQIPSCTVEPAGERTLEDGRFNNSIFQIYEIKFLVIYGFINPKNSRTEGTKTIYDFSDQLRKSLALDKTLGGVVDEFNARWDVRDLNVEVGSGVQGYYIARQIIAEWGRYLDWSSRANAGSLDRLVRG